MHKPVHRKQNLRQAPEADCKKIQERQHLRNLSDDRMQGKFVEDRI